MLRLFTGFAGALFKGLYFTMIAIMVIRMFTKKKESLLRRFLCTSYRLYAAILNWLDPYIKGYLGINILDDGYPRVIAAICLSLGLGYILFSLLHMRFRFWITLALIAHGLFVGKQWDLILNPKDFQMGVRIDE